MVNWGVELESQERETGRGDSGKVAIQRGIGVASGFAGGFAAAGLSKAATAARRAARPWVNSIGSRVFSKIGQAAISSGVSSITSKTVPYGVQTNWKGGFSVTQHRRRRVRSTSPSVLAGMALCKDSQTGSCLALRGPKHFITVSIIGGGEAFRAHDRAHQIEVTCQVLTASASSGRSTSSRGVGTLFDQVQIATADCGSLILRRGGDCSE